MINDLNIAGIYIPGILAMALVALIGTLSLIPLLSISRLYTRLPLRPLLDLGAYIVTFFLLLHGNSILELLV